ncbi:hypothetical protein NHJ13051_002288 [Beauveria bassiana]
MIVVVVVVVRERRTRRTSQHAEFNAVRRNLTHRRRRWAHARAHARHSNHQTAY